MPSFLSFVFWKKKIVIPFSFFSRNIIVIRSCSSLKVMPLIMDRATTSQVKPQKHSSFHCTHRCSTSPLVLDCWELTHMIFLVLSKKELLAKLSKFIKSQLFTQLICTHYSNLSGRPNISLGSGTQGSTY